MLEIKMFSIVPLVWKWSGIYKAMSVNEFFFFDTFESTAIRGNWSVSDVIRITVLKLTDLAKAFYGNCVELQGAEVM